MSNPGTRQRADMPYPEGMLKRWMQIWFPVVLATHVDSMPAGTWIQDWSERECCAARLEITGEGKAWYRKSDDALPAEVTEIDGVLHVESAGTTQWVLKPDGDGWLDQDQRHWTPREKMVKTGAEWTDVTIRVEDQTGAAQKQFGIRYWIVSSAGNWDPLLVRPLETTTGTFVFKAPADCTINLHPEHPDFVRGYNSPVTLTRKKGAEELLAKFQRGKSIAGKVVDEASGQALAGATVSPLIFTPPMFSPDIERSVTTGPDGSFVLRGVDRSLQVAHPDHVEMDVYLKDDAAANPLIVPMKSGDSIHGIVTDPSGKPLADVEVEDGTGKKTLTDAEGRFVLRGLRKWNDDWNITFEKQGFNDFTFEGNQLDPAGLEIRLQTLPVLRGRVLSANGEPMTDFHIICGPGPAPQDYQCESMDVKNGSGSFAITPDRLPEKGDGFWIGVKAADAAPWGGVILREKLETGGHVIQLKPGVTLSATLTLPESAKGTIRADLDAVVPKPADSFTSDSSADVTLASSSVSLNAGDPLRFQHLRPGKYELRIHGSGFTPMVREVSVENDDVHLGNIPFKGTGTIIGSLTDPYEAGKPWPFADGKVRIKGFEKPVLSFKTDKDGNFHVKGVPTGKVEVAFEYNETADMIGAKVAEVTVPEGGEVKVVFKAEEPHEDGGIPSDLPPIE